MDSAQAALDPARRTSMVAFNVAGHDPVRLAEALDAAPAGFQNAAHVADQQ